MNKIWIALPTLVGIAALSLVVIQRGELRQLRRQLDQPPAGATAPVSSGGELSAERRLAALEQTVARVFGMLLTARGSQPAAAGAREETRSKDSNLRQDVDALLTGEALATEQGRKRLHQIVREVQQQARNEQHQQREQWWEQMQKERLKSFAKDAALNANQAERIGTLLDTERTQRRDLRQTVQRGEKTFTQLMTEMQTLRQSTDQKAKEILDSKQYADYEKMRQERGGWRPR